MACAPYYGLIPWEGAAPDYSRLQAPVRGHYAENDGFFAPAMARALEQELRETHGKDVEFTIHPGVDHAFFNDTRPEVYDRPQAEAAFADTVAFFHRAIS